MKIKTSEQNIINALNSINKEYDDNIEFNRFDRTGNRWTVTLKVKDSNKEGARRGTCFANSGERRKLISACWHVHGNFFNALLEDDSNCVIQSLGKKIYMDDGYVVGNWEDRNAGSIVDPVYMSELCEC